MEEVAGETLKELRYLSEFSVAERVKFLWLLALDLNKLGYYAGKISLDILGELNAENIHIKLDLTKTEIKDVHLVFPEGLRVTQQMDVTESKSHVRLFGVIASEVFPSKDNVPAKLSAFIASMISDVFNERPPFSKVLQFFTELNNDCLLEQSFENTSNISQTAEDVWKMFFYDPKHFVGKESIWRKCAVEIAENINDYTMAQVFAFLRELDRCGSETKLRNQALETYIPQTPEDHVQLFLYLSEGENYKGYENKLNGLARAVLQNICGNENPYSDEQCLAYFRQYSPEDRLRLFFDVNSNEVVRRVLNSCVTLITSEDGERTYAADTLNNIAYLVDRDTNQPDFTRKFYVTAFNEEDRSYYQQQAEKLHYYFETEIASTYLITEYSAQQDWSVYDGRTRPKDLPLVDRLNLLCDMLRELAEKKPPSRDYIWPRAKIEKFDDTRKEVGLLVPVIMHYLGVSDPLDCGNNGLVVMVINNLKKLMPATHDHRLLIAMQNFLLSMVAAEHERRPDAHKLLRVFEALRDYCQNNFDENLELLECTTDSASVFQSPELPHSFKCRWLLFLYGSKEENYRSNPPKWRRLTKTILDDMDECSEEQVNVLLGILFSRGMEYLKKIDINQLNIKDEHRQALSNLIEVARENPERSRLEERARLFHFAETRAPYFQKTIDEVYGPDLELHLFLHANDEVTQVTRLKYAINIVSNFNVYTSQEMLTFLQAVQPASLQHKVIEKLVDGLKFYKENLFYFNPRRFTVTKQIRALENRSFDNLNGLPEKLVRKVPLKHIGTLKNSKSEFKRYSHYELIKVNAKTFYVVDFEKKLGYGTFGDVYEAYRVDPNTGEYGEKFAVKIFKKTVSQIKVKKEFHALRKSFMVREPLYNKSSKRTYLITEYVPGQEVDANAVWSLPFEQRMKAILMTALELNRMHHIKIKSKTEINGIEVIDALVHGDIKIANIKLLIEDGIVTDVRVLDYGFANALDSDDATQLVPVQSSGTPRYVSPEVVLKQGGIKSDIRSWVPVILHMLGVINPFVTDENIQPEFSFRGIFRGVNAEIPFHLQALIILFLRRMASYKYADRPSSDDALIFFHAMYNYFQYPDARKEEWFVKNEGLIGQYAPTSFDDKWALFLCFTENNENADLPELVILARELNPHNIDDKLKLFAYFTENFGGNEDKWAEHALAILNDRNSSDKQKLQCLLFLNIHAEKGVEIVPTLYKDNLSNFIQLSKTQRFRNENAIWEILAHKIADNIQQYTGQEMLIFLRKLNKFNGDGEHDVIRDKVIAKLLQGIRVEEPAEKTAETRAEMKVRDAVNGNFFMFKNYRTKRALRSCALEVADEQVKSVVNRLGKPQAV